MAEPASQALDTFRRAADALEKRDWHGVAALCDPISLRVFHRQLVEQFAPRTPPPESTVSELRRHQPDMPPEVAEYQIKQMQQLHAERLSRMEDEVAGVHSVEELRALDPVEACARSLEAHDPEHQVRLFLARHRKSGHPRELGVYAMPRERLEPIGVVVEDRFAHVPYRRTSTSRAPAEGEHRERFLEPYTAEERAWLRDAAGRHVEVATLLRQPDGSWRLCAEHGLFQGTTWFGRAEINVIAEQQPPPSEP